jgi:hypothetical protein
MDSTTAHRTRKTRGPANRACRCRHLICHHGMHDIGCPDCGSDAGMSSGDAVMRACVPDCQSGTYPGYKWRSRLVAGISWHASLGAGDTRGTYAADARARGLPACRACVRPACLCLWARVSPRAACARACAARQPRARPVPAQASAGRGWGPHRGAARGEDYPRVTFYYWDLSIIAAGSMFASEKARNVLEPSVFLIIFPGISPLFTTSWRDSQSRNGCRSMRVQA